MSKAVTYPQLIRAVASGVLALRHQPTQASAQALIGRLYVLADGLEQGTPADQVAGDPQEFALGDPAEFTAGDPPEFAHITVPAVRTALRMGPVGPFTVEFELAAEATFAAYDADAENPNVPDRSNAIDAVHRAVYPETGDRSRADAYRALRSFWMDEPLGGNPERPADLLPYLATFQGEAWINDHATAVDDARYSFPVSAAEVEDCADRENRVYDELADAAQAPLEVRAWSGPFTISLAPRRFMITSDRPGEPTRYCDEVEQAQRILLDHLEQDLDDIDGENAGWIDDLEDTVEDAAPGTTWTFEGDNRHLTLQFQRCAE